MPSRRPPRRIPVPDALLGGRRGGGRRAIVTRVRYRPGASYDAHCHDHHELFWIEEGEAVHRVGEGNQEQIQLLPARTVVFVRPDDVHAFSTPRGRGFTMVNVVFRGDVVRDLERRYAADVLAWPWLDRGAQHLPTRLRLDRAAAAAAQVWADALSRRGDRLSLDGLLLHLLAPLARAALPSATFAADPPPGWLSRALMAFGEPQNLGGGLAGFIRLAGRSTAHVNRAVRRHLGKTTTTLVNDLRLEHAARQLRMGDEPVLSIALACGFGGLAHFYRLFRRAHGSTPRAYRKRHRAMATIGWS